MAYSPNKDFLLEVAKGNVAGHSLRHVHAYGQIATTTPGLIGAAGGYGGSSLDVWTPSSASTLEVISTDADDTAAGDGAREITVEGLDGSFNFATETIATAGTSASTATSTSFIRIYRAYVSASGSYAVDSTSSPQSMQGQITLRVSSGGRSICYLYGYSTSYYISSGESGSGVYTVPNGKTAYMLRSTISVAGGSGSDPHVQLAFRENADDTTAPVSAIRALTHYLIDSDVGTTIIMPTLDVPHQFSAKTDVFPRGRGTNSYLTWDAVFLEVTN